MSIDAVLTTQTLIVALAALAGVAIVASSLLRGFQGWLQLKSSEIEALRQPAEPGGSPYGIARIEMADLKERVRHLEAIASGVDL